MLALLLAVYTLAATAAADTAADPAQINIAAAGESFLCVGCASCFDKGCRAGTRGPCKDADNFCREMQPDGEGDWECPAAFAYCGRECPDCASNTEGHCQNDDGVCRSPVEHPWAPDTFHCPEKYSHCDPDRTTTTSTPTVPMTTASSGSDARAIC